MIRRIIEIDEARCNGCGLCAKACHEGAIGMVNGKAKLMRDDYCDGLGDCLPTCPTGAIRFVEREAEAYNEEEVKKNMQKKENDTLACGCPGSHARELTHSEPPRQEESCACAPEAASRLRQWPVQIKLIPANAPYFDGANLLIAADCAAYAYANFHEKFMRNKITLIGCPKLDAVDYSEKLAQILSANEIKSVTVVRMEVPCCGGIENAVKSALAACGKMIPWQVLILSTDGKLMED